MARMFEESPRGRIFRLDDGASPALGTLRRGIPNFGDRPGKAPRAEGGMGEGSGQGCGEGSTQGRSEVSTEVGTGASTEVSTEVGGEVSTEVSTEVGLLRLRGAAAAAAAAHN